MRPKSVKLGEQLYATSIVLGLVLAVQGFDEAVLALGFGVALGTNALLIGLLTLLLVLTARGGARIALWALTILTALMLLVFLWEVSSGFLSTGFVGVLTTMQMLLSVVAIVLFFRPAARDFFARPHPEWEEDA